MGSLLLATVLLITPAFGKEGKKPATPAPPAVQFYNLGGKQYPAEVVDKAFEAAKKKYAYDVKSREAIPAGNIKAQYVEGLIVHRTGARYMLKTGDTHRLIFIRNGHTPPVDKPVGFMLVERSASMKQRIPGGDVVSMKQYTDVTLLPADFVRSFNRGQPIGGTTFEPVKHGLDDKNKMERLDSQMERRTTTINKK